MILNIGEKIGNLRAKTGLTQTDLAKLLGISRSSVNFWEMSLSSPSVANIIEMSKIFNVPTDYFLSENDKELIDITGLTFEQKELIYKMVALFKKEQ
ncbi:MAG: helix-turn-helix transcriptional regulator [Clostridia bacterium]|nr:helix-turn-helix transcriptional regulator [Clostridia bacterium]